MTLIRLQPETFVTKPDIRRQLRDGDRLKLGDDCELMFRVLPWPRIKVVGKGVKGLPLAGVSKVDLRPLAPWVVSVVAIEYDQNELAQVIHLALNYQTAKHEEVSREEQ